MKYTGILEKLLLIYEIIESSMIYITFIGIVFLTLFLMLNKKITKKTSFIINLLSITGLISYTIYNHFDTLAITFDNIMNNIFTNIYFPSFYTYLFILIFVNVISITSLFKITLNKTYKTINGICMLLIDFILVLILEIIAKNQIDLFSKVSLFSNTSLVMLLELSVNVFITWIIIISILYLANIITERKIIKQTNKELTKKPAVITPLEVNLNTLEEEYLSTGNKFIPQDIIKENSLPNSYKFIPTIETNPKINEFNNNSFDLSSLIPKQTELKPLDNKQIIAEVEQAKESIIIEVPKVIEERDTYTLNDYKIFNKMLKDIKEHNKGSVISIDKNLEYRLITKYSNEKYDMFKRMLKIYSN